MTPDFSTRARVQGNVALDRALVVASVAAVLLSATSAWRAVHARDEARGRAMAVRREVEPLRSRLRALEAGARGGGTVRSQAELTVSATPPRVIADLAALLPSDARLERLALGYGKDLLLDLEVGARSPTAYDRLLESLVSSERLSDVRSGPEEREGEVKASITARYRPAERTRRP
jgi:hypothetical protein